MTSKVTKMSTKTYKNTLLPVSRVKMIMKSSPEVTSVSQEALYLITLSTELFVQHLAKMAMNNRNKKRVEYGDLAEVVNLKSTLEFLQDIIPTKIVAKDFLEIVKNEKEIKDDDYI